MLLSYRIHRAALSSRGHYDLSSHSTVDAVLSPSIELFTMIDDFDKVLHEPKPHRDILIRRIEVCRHVVYDRSVFDGACTA